jgi:hypothetical protein
MLIEANDEGLLKKYFENQIEKETKELIKSDPNFAWVSELGVKGREQVKNRINEKDEEIEKRIKKSRKILEKPEHQEKLKNIKEKQETDNNLLEQEEKHPLTLILENYNKIRSGELDNKDIQIKTLKNILISIENYKVQVKKLGSDGIKNEADYHKIEDKLSEEQKNNFIKLFGDLKGLESFFKELGLDLNNLDKNQKCILLVNAKRHNSKLIEAALQVLEKKQCTVVGALLYESYDMLQRMYYFPGSKWMKKHLK